MHHILKIWPRYFEAVKSGEKTFEVRDNDRGFQKGDTVTLREYEIQRDYYTARELNFKIGYVYPLQDGRVIFSLLSVEDSK